MPYNTRSKKLPQVTGGESSCAIGKQQQTPEMAGTTGSRKRKQVTGGESRCVIRKQEKAPKSPDYTPPGSPKYAPAYSPPHHTELCKVNGKPVTTMALSIWGGEEGSGKHTCTPKSPDYTPPCSPTYAPAYSPPEYTPLDMVDGKPWRTVALSVWDGDQSSGKHKCTPKSPDYTPPGSPKYAPARAQQPGSGTRCGTPTYALEPV